MSHQQCEAVRQQATALIKDAMSHAGRHDGLALPRSEAQVHRAIDLLRATSVDNALLAAAESLSCTMREMDQLLRQGRVNAYDSRALRVKKLFEAL